MGSPTTSSSLAGHKETTVTGYRKEQADRRSAETQCPAKLITTLSKISLVPNKTNATIIEEFRAYMKARARQSILRHYISIIWHYGWHSLQSQMADHIAYLMYIPSNSILQMPAGSRFQCLFFR
jgi:hypothetical protein